MRSAREIGFRLAQQIANARFLAFPPSLSAKAVVADVVFPKWLDPAQPVRELADEILQHRFPLLGSVVETGPDIEWRRDYVHQKITPPTWFRLVPYLDFNKSGDHKNIWELNRHQHLVLLAQAFLLTGRETYRSEIASELDSWWAQNPFVKGINWASALEVAFRAISWMWMDDLAGSALPQELRGRLWNSLYQHGCYLEHNLSTYFSPNTHLLGEGVALYALGRKFPGSGWEALGQRVVQEELRRQIKPDGSHFEQSTYYHVYALDFFLLYHVLAGRPDWLVEPLEKMAGFLAAINGTVGPLNYFGDDDGGRLFHPYGDPAQFGMASLRLYELEMRKPAPPCPDAMLFPDSGLAAVNRGELHILMDAGPFGPGGAGHSHSDTLSLTIRHGAEEILIDPGTFTYVADPQLRDAFRGSAFHNTIRVDGLDQGDAAKPFRWENKPEVRIREWKTSLERVFLDAECASRGVTHRRRFLLLGSSVLLIVDEVSGAAGRRELEQFWHAGAPVTLTERGRCRIGSSEVYFAGPATPEEKAGWRSRVLGSKEPAPVIQLRWKGEFPQLCATAFVFSGDLGAARLSVARADAGITLDFGGIHEVFQD